MDPGARRRAMPTEQFVRAGSGSSRSGWPACCSCSSPSLPWLAHPRPSASPGRDGPGLLAARAHRPARARRPRPRACHRSLSLTDSLGTALGTGITGAVVAASVRATGNPASRARGRLRVRRRDRGARPAADGPAAAADRSGRRPLRFPGVAAVVDGPDACGRLRAASRGTLPAPRFRPPVEASTVSAEELREDPRGPRLPEARDPVLRHHDPAQGRRGVQGSHRPDARAVRRRADRHRRRDGVARLHLQRADGLPARTPGSCPSASSASCRPRRSPSSTPSSTARTPSRSIATPSPRPEGPDRRRPARDRRHGPGHDRARRAAQGRGRRPGLPRRARLPQGSRPARRTRVTSVIQY